jgi:hypothetical protein
MLFEERITVYSENETKLIDAFYGQTADEVTVKAGCID